MSVKPILSEALRVDVGLQIVTGIHDQVAGFCEFGVAVLVEPGDVEKHDARGVIAVDTLGACADFDQLAGLCRSADIKLVEDAACSIGATRGGLAAGSFGDCATFSFNGNKTVTAGGGGAIVTDNDDLAESFRHLSTQARVGDRYSHDAAGWNYRMTNLNAAVGVAQLERLNDMMQRKRQIAAVYDRVIEGREDLRVMPRPLDCCYNIWLYSVLCASREDAQKCGKSKVADGLRAPHAPQETRWPPPSLRSTVH